MFRRIVPKVQHPCAHPHDAHASKRHERAAPPDRGDEPRHDWRGDGISQPRKRVGDPLCEPSALDRRPALHRARRDRKRRAFADAEEHPHQEQRHEPAGEAGQDRRSCPDETAHEERPARPEAIPDPAAEHLKEQIRIRKCGKDEPELRVGERELLSDFARGGGDVHAIDVRDQVHQAQEPEHHPRRARDSHVDTL